MGKPEEANAVTSSGGCHISKRVGWTLAFLAIASVVVAGLLTYYVGVMNVQCNPAENAGGPQPITQKPSKPKVTKLSFIGSVGKYTF